MPAPAGALTVLLPVYLALLGLISADVYIVVPVILHILFTAFMMVSNLPTYSGKRIGARVHRNVVLPLLVVVVMTVALVVSYPFVMLTLGVLAYLVTLPVAWNDFRRRMARDRDRAGAKDKA